MDITIHAGESEFTYQIPDESDVFQAPQSLGYPDIKIAIIKRLLQPIGYDRTLFDMAKNCKTACIVIDVMTPGVVIDAVLVPILTTLHASGLEPANIELLMTAEYPLQVTEKQIADILSEDIISNYNIVTHNPLAFSHHILVGKTQRDTPVYLDRGFIQADMRIAIGLVMPHFIAGFSGAPSLIGFGLSGPETIQALYAPKNALSPQSRCGVDISNPVYEDLEQILKISKLNFMVNIVLDEENHVARIFSGNAEKAFREAVDVYKSELSIPVKKKYDAVFIKPSKPSVVSDWFSDLLSVANASQMLKPNGILVFSSKHFEHFSEMQLSKFAHEAGAKELMGFDKMINSFYEKVIDLLSNIHLIIVSSHAPKSCVRNKYMTICGSPENTQDIIQEKLGKDPEIAVLPDISFSLVKTA